jgi:hypothetical protein
VLTVWGRPNSINVQKVLWCCTELGLSPRRIAVGGEFGGNQDADYVAMNPNRLRLTMVDISFGSQTSSFVTWPINTAKRTCFRPTSNVGSMPSAGWIGKLLHSGRRCVRCSLDR